MHRIVSFSLFATRAICWAVLLLLTLALAASGARADDANETPTLRWWKGNIHTHTLWSDGNDFPEMVADWYRARGYNFLALSDHNILSEGVRWIKHDEIVRRGGHDALEKYRRRFGPHWVETRGEPNTPEFAVRLKPLGEFRALVEAAGQFIMIAGEEISDRAEGKPVHMNATNLKELVMPVGGATVREAIANNLRAVQEQARRSGREILLHLNHPNFGWAVTAEDLAAVVAERFFEVYNGHPAVKHLGDADHPSVEQIWDIANTLRLAQLQAPPLYGIAVDDSHKYHGETGSRPGRGWIMVRSRYLTPEHLIRAIRAGDFYASSGVTLREVTFDAASQTLSLQIEPQEGVAYVTQFIGTLMNRGANGGVLGADDKSSASNNIGMAIASEEGISPSYQLTGQELYVRAVVISSKAHPDPSFANQREQAWTQPVGWEANLK